jgi:4-hydroxymandelate oxidase
MEAARRRFLTYLAASPLMMAQQPGDGVLAKPEDALNLMDFEPAARAALPPAHFGYMATGVDGDVTLRANRDGFNRIYLRPRRLVDVTKADTAVELFGESWKYPIGLAPIGNQKAFHAEGEAPVVRAAKATGTLQILSTAANTAVEDVKNILGRAPWYQLYVTSRWENTERLVRRVEEAGCRVMAVTVDTQAGRRTETFERLRKLDKRDCVGCHGTTRADFYRRKPMLSVFEATPDLNTQNPAMTWEHLRRIRAMTKMKLLLKGVETAEDAALCVESGLDGVIVSNHGGRAEESGRGTIDCLPEVVQASAGRVPVFIDGGFRRGTDVFKALALGAKAVFIGRPYVWGLAAFGQPGVERVIEMLRLEFELAMKQCGARTVAEIVPKMVGRLG